MSDTKAPPQTVDRRAFLRSAVLGAGAAGAAAAVAAGSASAEAVTATTDPTGKTDAGYRKTDHVRRYYDLARF
ncbi:hypothetical protein [Caenispirillum bisanense]|uniref:hypothetical protein n=1 Tax=Caenispirillum bisanense TaxID=414052 RepID=UPI0031E1C9FD